MTEPKLIAIELIDDEREFMVIALGEFGGTASYTPFSDQDPGSVD